MTLLLAVVAFSALSGCAGRPVHLLTGWGALGPPESGIVGCYTYFTVGELVVDAEFGTAIVEGDGAPVPVMWRPGFTGRQAGSEVEVVNSAGEVVARTGNRYQIEGAHSARYPLPGFLACGYVLPM
jgi:hypothetical protein